MIKRLFAQVIETISVAATTETQVEDRDAALRLATAVLMVDVARADSVFDESEFDRVLQLVEKRLCTPLVLAFRNKAVNRVALCSAFFILTAGLRSQISKLLALMGFEGPLDDGTVADDGAMKATALGARAGAANEAAKKKVDIGGAAGSVLAKSRPHGHAPHTVTV